MAACVLCRRGLRPRFLPGLRKDFTQAQHIPVKRVEETDDQDGRNAVPQNREASPSEGYRLYYSPSSYYRSVRSSATSRRQTEDEDECLPALAPSFWQQSNRYSVSCSRHLSSTKNTLLDLAFNKCPEPEAPPLPLYNKNTPPDVKVDPRAFLKCRPEYASMALDLTRPHLIEWEEALVLFERVTVLKGSMTPSDVTQFLSLLGRLPSDKTSLARDDHRFNMLLRYSVEHLRSFTALQLLEVLQSFARLDMPSAHTVLGLYEAELSRRADQMDSRQLLLAADLWHNIGRQVPRFSQRLLDSVSLSLTQMEAPELVLLLYITGESRQFPADLIRPVEHLLMRHLKELHPEEVSAVCLGLFKSQTSISTGAVTRLVDKALSCVEDMSDFGLVNVMKCLRFNYLYHAAWLEAMTREIPQRAHGMGVKGLMHVALTCSALHYHNDKILMAIAERVPLLLPHCRSKDACKLLWAFGTLGFLPHQSPNFYPSLTVAVRQRKAEFQQYPQHLLTGLLGLAFVSQFPEDLIALALSSEFVSLALTCKQLELKKDLFALDGTVALELPQWKGPRLSAELSENVAEMLWNYTQSDVGKRLEVQEAEFLLQELLGGEEFVSKRMILPHTRSIDLEVHLDSRGKPLPINPATNTAALSQENSSPKSPSHQDWERITVGVTITDELLGQLMNTKSKTKPLTPSPAVRPTALQKVEPDEAGRLFETGLPLTSDLTEALLRPRGKGAASRSPRGLVKLAIQVPNRNHYCCHSQRLLGLHVMKRRQLKLAGYRVVDLGYQEWSSMLRKSKTEKLAYLQCKIFNSVE